MLKKDVVAAGRRNWVARLLRFSPYLAPLAIILTLLVQTCGIILYEPLGHDEAELLHASYLMAHGAVPWVDFFENHSPVYLWINAHLLAPDSVLYAFYARLFYFAVYLLGACLFGIAGILWLDVERALRWPIMLLSLVVYLPLAWTIEFGIVRPEGLAFAALFAGCIAGHYVTSPSAHRAWLFACGALLALAALISMRTVPLCAVMGVLVIWRSNGYGTKLAGVALLVIGALSVAALEAMTAPLAGFYLWLIDFNGHFVSPFPRQLPSAAYSSISVDLVAIAATAGAAAVLLAERRDAPLATRIVAIVGRSSLIALALVFVAIALGWLFVLTDHAWGAQGFSAIVVASASYVCVLALIVFRVCRNGVDVFFVRLVLTGVNGLSGIGQWYRTRTLRHPRWRHAAIFSLSILCAAALAMAVLARLLHSREIGGLVHWVRQWPAASREGLDTIIGWPGWVMVPCALCLLALAPQLTAAASRWRRVSTKALAIRLEFVLVTVVVADLVATILREVAVWQNFRHWPSVEIANAFSAAVAIGSVWPRIRMQAWAYAALITLAQLILAISSPSQVGTGSLVGLAVAVAFRHWSAARGFAFLVDKQGRVKGLPGPSWRRIHRMIICAVGIAPRARSGNATVNEPSWRRPPPLHSPAQINADPRAPFVRAVAATALFGLSCFGLAENLNATNVRYELSLQHPSFNFYYVREALTEGSYHPHSLEGLMPLNESRNLGQWILWSRRYCQLLRNETVAMRPTMHPVCVKDNSFYWYGGEDILRLRSAYPNFTPQPPYNLAGDIRKNKPALIDVIFLQISIPSRELDSLVSREYVRLGDRKDKGTILVRRDWLRRQFPVDQY